MCFQTNDKCFDRESKEKYVWKNTLIFSKETYWIWGKINI